MRKGNLPTILRCTGLALLVLGAFALLPTAAQAQCTNTNHGVTIEKSCTSPKNVCATDADCANGDLCDGVEQCATAHPNGVPSGVGSNVVDCTITLTNPAIHCDDIRIEEAADQILNGTALPNSTITISATSGAVTGTCAVGTDLGGANTCTLPPGASVSFSANYYTVQATDPNPLPDQATITVRDLCNVQTTGCNSLTTNGVQFTASTSLQSGCSDGTPLVCDDGLFCTDDSCVPATGCTTVAHPCADDGAFCNGPESCDETANACVSGPAVVCQSDGNACNGPEACDETTDACASGPAVVCTDDANLCNGPETCVPETGACVSGPPLVCDDGLFCTDDSCVPATGCTTTAHNCDDSLFCTNDSCDETADACVNAPVVCTQDANLCNTEACDPADGICKSGATTTCASDGVACNGPESCDPATGGCVSPTPVVCNSDNNACNGPEACVEPTGTCESGPPLICDDGLFCTDDSCVPASGCTTTAHNCDDQDVCTVDTCNEDLNQCDNVPSTDPSCLPAAGRMTGGGSIFTKAGGRVTHGFELHCDPEIGPNNLEINWGPGNHFHLTELLTAVCTDDPAIAPRPPSADFDTYNGTGTGSCNGVDGATITFTLTDAGEPGKKDFASYEISGCPGGLTLTVSGNLNKGNQQAHKTN